MNVVHVMGVLFKIVINYFCTNLFVFFFKFGLLFCCFYQTLLKRGSNSPKFKGITHLKSNIFPREWWKHYENRIRKKGSDILKFKVLKKIQMSDRVGDVIPSQFVMILITTKHYCMFFFFSETGKSIDIYILIYVRISIIYHLCRLGG